MNTICGLNKPTKGDIIFDGQNIAGKKPNQIARLGLSMAPEGSHCFERMTVQDNLLMGAYLAKKDERMQRLENVYKLFPILKEKANQNVNVPFRWTETDACYWPWNYDTA